MDLWLDAGLDLAVILTLIVGIYFFRAPLGARFGNYAAALAMAGAVALVLVRHGLVDPVWVLAAVLLGALPGVWVALKVDMIAIPSMVAFQHGMGGVAALLISFVEMTGEPGGLSPVGEVSGFLGLVIGSATFSGSLVASAKLANRMRQAPTSLPFHGGILLALLAAILGLSALLWDLGQAWAFGGLVGLVALAMALGYLFAIRIGGADMPVLISFLNAAAGLAAAFCGVVIQNRLLIACGATVAASGSILTHVMCRAMNRGLIHVFRGTAMARPAGGAAEVAAAAAAAAAARPAGGDLAAGVERAVALATSAQRIVIIPGYGMALARAQFDVVRLANHLEGQGKQVRFAIHPVAGRMPGHMNVLLAEADVDYEKLCEMDDINQEFPETDLVVIVGACDVVNPAAIEKEGTPLSGMPILMAHLARNIAVCNLDARPGYSGVENPLYTDPKTILLFGDAQATVGKILAGLTAQGAG